MGRSESPPLRSGGARTSFASEAPRAAREFAQFRLARRSFLKSFQGDGRPVLVLPGFLGSDGSTLALRRLLRAMNYHVHAMRLGRNLGPTDRILNGLRERVPALLDEHGQPLTLIGHSLGGIYSREIARAAPGAVRQVITLGSPFRRPARTDANSPVGPIFQALSPMHSDRARNVDPDRMLEPLPVPLTAIFTRTDGVVPWKLCTADASPRSECIEVEGSHSGLIHNPAAVAVILDRLSLDEWRPFSASDTIAAKIFKGEQ